MYLLDIVIRQLVTLCHSDRPHVPACNKVYCNLNESVKLIVVDAACFFCSEFENVCIGGAVTRTAHTSLHVIHFKCKQLCLNIPVTA